MNGANQSLLTLVNYLKDKVEVQKVYVPTNDDIDEGLPVELRKIGVAVETLSYRPFLYFSGLKSFLAIPFKFIMNIPSWIKLYNELKNKDIDYIYSNSSVEHTGIIIAKLLGIKHIWHIREFGYGDYKYYFLGGIWAKRMIINMSNKIIVISKAISNYVNLHHKTNLIHNGIFYEAELESLEVKPDLTNTVCFGMVGVIGVAKNQKRAINLIKELQNKTTKKLCINFYGSVAEINYMNELQQLIADNHLEDSINFLGFVKDKKTIYRAIDVLLMCSPNEAFGRVTVEAMAFGIPVIGFDNAGTSELIDHGSNGLLFNDKYNSLETVALSLIEDKKLYRKLSNQAKISANLYSVERYGDSIYKLICKKEMNE